MLFRRPMSSVSVSVAASVSGFEQRVVCTSILLLVLSLFLLLPISCPRASGSLFSNTSLLVAKGLPAAPTRAIQDKAKEALRHQQPHTQTRQPRSKLRVYRLCHTPQLCLQPCRLKARVAPRRVPLRQDLADRHSSSARNIPTSL
jgi:hypothetical protein